MKDFFRNKIERPILNTPNDILILLIRTNLAGLDCDELLYILKVERWFEIKDPISQIANSI